MGGRRLPRAQSVWDEPPQRARGRARAREGAIVGASHRELRASNNGRAPRRRPRSLVCRLVCVATACCYPAPPTRHAHMALHLPTRGGARALLAARPALAQQWRCFGFGSHMSDNNPEASGGGVRRGRGRAREGVAAAHRLPRLLPNPPSCLGRTAAGQGEGAPPARRATSVRVRVAAAGGGRGDGRACVRAHSLRTHRPPTRSRPLARPGKTVPHVRQVPGWSEKLASDSEAVVKAERESPVRARVCVRLRGGVWARRVLTRPPLAALSPGRTARPSRCKRRRSRRCRCVRMEQKSSIGEGRARSAPCPPPRLPPHDAAAAPRGSRQAQEQARMEEDQATTGTTTEPKSGRVDT